MSVKLVYVVAIISTRKLNLMHACYCNFITENSRRNDSMAARTFGASLHMHLIICSRRVRMEFSLLSFSNHVFDTDIRCRPFVYSTIFGRFKKLGYSYVELGYLSTNCNRVLVGYCRILYQIP
jgi:hypothetical protein